VPARDPIARALELLVGEAPPFLVGLSVDLAHRVVERRGATGAPPYLEVEDGPEDRTLPVVRGRDVRGVLVLAIEPDPRVEARLLGAHQPAGRERLDLVDVVTDEVEELRGGDQLGPAEDDVLVVARHAL